MNGKTVAGGTWSSLDYLNSPPEVRAEIDAWLVEHDVVPSETTRVQFEWVGVSEFCIAGQFKKQPLRFSVKRPFPIAVES